MTYLQPYFDYFVHVVLEYFALHPNWAIALVFVISLGEALLVIGLVVPSTAVLIGAGTLIGAGKLPFWPIMIASILGCIAGDQISYWAGRIYGDRLRTLWPLKNYPHLLAKGEEYVRLHGGKSIAIGRFVPGIKAVVPGIAGMFGMSQSYFLTVNFFSGIVWAALHVLPGVVLGHAFLLAGELSGRLLIVLFVLLIILAVGGWLVRVIVASMTPYRKAIQGRISAWASKSEKVPIRRFGKVIAPENPNSVLFVLLILVGFISVIALFDLVSGLLIRQAVSQFDHSLFNFFSELRSVPGDEIFIRLTMLGDQYVIYAVAAVLIIWSALRRNWRATVAIFLTVAVAHLVIIAFSFGFAAPGTGAQNMDFKFPAPHALMAGTVFGMVALITSRGLSRWTQAIIAASCAMLVMAISFSRLYLGVNWFSDVIGGVLIALILVAIFSVAISTIKLRRFHPLWLLATACLALIIATGIDVEKTFDKRFERYQPVNKTTVFSTLDYVSTGWSKVPGQRIDLVGKPRDVFQLQWIGSLDTLQAVLRSQNFVTWNRWSLRDALPYLSPTSPLAEMAPNPVVHEGLRAKTTATAPDVKHADYRLALRAFQSNSVVVDGDTKSRVYLINITHEFAKRDFGFFAVPTDQPVDADELKEVLARLAADPNVDKLAERQIDNKLVVILRPKS